MPSRSSPTLMIRGDRGPPFAKLRRDSLHAPPSAASEDWRRGESNPCPRSFQYKLLHVYPMLIFKEPNDASAHCRLPSVREILSPVRRGRSAVRLACCPCPEP